MTYDTPHSRDIPFIQAGIGMFLQTDGDLVVNYKPKLILTEYLALMASVVGLWLGLSAYSLLEVAFRLCSWK